MKQKKLSITQIILIGFIVLLLAVVVLAIYGATLTPAERKHLQEDFGADVLNLCAPPSSVPEQYTGYPAGTLFPLRTLVLDGGANHRHSWGKALPAEWQANSRAELGLVVCVERKKVDDYVCDANGMWGTSTGGTIKVEVVQATVINPATGAVLERTNFKTNSGSQACSAKRAGNAEQFLDMVRPYILGTSPS